MILFFNVSKIVSNTPQKQAKNEQFGRRIYRVFVDFELKTKYSHHPEPGALTGLSHTPKQ